MSAEPSTIEEAVLEELRRLPLEKQREVLDFAEFLGHQEGRIVRRPLRSVEGLAADLGVSISAEEIDEARREMWANFPREFPVDD
jgi:hypothetical protein